MSGGPLPVAQGMLEPCGLPLLAGVRGAKLLLVDRLPINILGAVLNGVNLKGEFDYYGYASGYSFTEDVTESESTAVQVT